MPKFRQLIAKLQSEQFAVEPNFAQDYLDALNDYLANPTHTEIAQEDSVTYEKIGAVAVIAVDGAMYKKSMSGLCFSVVGYEQINKLIDKAEADSEIETIVFRVDSPGGAVAGVDELATKIENSPKETITFYDNRGASAAVWGFSSSKKIYAHKTTMIGSIGVISQIRVRKQSDNVVEYTLVSKNAPNKVCDPSEKECRDKVQDRINSIETMFFDRLTSRFSKDAETIKNDFSQGSVIFAEEAKKLGYIDDVLHFDELLAQLTPSTQSSVVNSAEGTGHNSIKGQQMPQDNGTEEQSARIEALTAEIAGLKEDMGGMVSLDTVKNAVAMAEQYEVSMNTLIAMIEAKDVKDAKIIALEARNEALGIKASKGDGATTKPTANNDNDEPVLSDEELQKIVEGV